MNKEIIAQIKWLENSLSVYQRAFDVAVKHGRKEKAIEYKKEIDKLTLEIRELKGVSQNLKYKKKI